MSVSDSCWHWQDTVLAAGCPLSTVLPKRLSLYNVASCDLFSLEFYYYFFTKYYTLLHVADVRTC